MPNQLVFTRYCIFFAYLCSIFVTNKNDFTTSKANKCLIFQVLIADSSYVINDSGLDVSEENSRLLDTSHVSVVKIDEEKVQVKVRFVF